MVCETQLPLLLLAVLMYRRREQDVNINDMSSIAVPQQLLGDIVNEKEIARQKRREVAQKRREDIEAKRRAEDLLTFAACYGQKLEVCLVLGLGRPGRNTLRTATGHTDRQSDAVV
jgi:hypothetical protein